MNVSRERTIVADNNEKVPALNANREDYYSPFPDKKDEFD